MNRLLIVGLSVLAGTATAQTTLDSDSLTMSVAPSDSTQSAAWISIATDPDSSEVFLDSLFLGRSPVSRQSVEPGKHVVRLYYPSRRSWNRTESVDTIMIDPGQHISRMVEMGTVLIIRSDPPEATVSLRGSILGTTPLYYSNRASLKDGLSLEKEGYVPRAVRVDQKADFPSVVRLAPATAQTDPLSHLRKEGVAERARDSWITYAVGATMVTSGVLAAHLNSKANKSFERYLATGNAADLDATRRFDRASTISLVVTEISFAVLAYLFLVD